MDLLASDVLIELEPFLAAQDRTWDGVASSIGKTGRRLRRTLRLSEPNFCSLTFFAILGELRVEWAGCRELCSYIEFLSDELKKSGRKLTDVARAAERRYETLRRVMKGEAIPRLNTLCILTIAILGRMPEFRRYQAAV